MNSKKILIGGEWRLGSEEFEVKAPWDGRHLATVSSANEGECEDSIAEAASASKEMRKLARFEIASGLRKIAAEIERRREDFASLIANEAAKPISMARGEADRAVATFSWAAGEAERNVGEIVPVDAQPAGRQKTAETFRIPKGVIYGITPFNFPLNLVAHKVAPALAAGNAIIIKPSQRTPLTSLLLGEVFLESGLPKSALQIVPMDHKFIPKVLADDRVAMISFTGAADVGWDLKAKAGRKSIALELGGNAPVIVDESAAVKDAIRKCTTGSFAYAGQVCISVQRIFAHSSVFDEFLDGLVSAAGGIKVLEPMNEKAQVSAMIDEAAAERAEKWIREGVDSGGELLCGGERDGSRLTPAILTNVNVESRVAAEEAFAPLVVVEKCDSFEDGVSRANASKFGLQAGVFTNDLRNSRYAARELEYGGVIINDVPQFRVDNMPYGGVKESGFGREGVRYAMDEMSEIRLVVTNS